MASSLKPSARVVPSVFHESIVDPVEDDECAEDEMDDFMLACEELFDKEDDSDGYWGFVLSLMFACVAIHFWSQVCLSYMARYPSWAVVSLVSLVFLSGWLYRFLEGQDDDEDDEAEALEELRTAGASCSRRLLIRAATIQCAKFRHHDEDLLPKPSSSTSSISTILESDEEDSSCPSMTHSEESNNGFGAAVASSSREVSLTHYRTLSRSRLACPPLSMVTTAPNLLIKGDIRKQVRFDISIESKGCQEPKLQHVYDKENIWYSRQELREMRRRALLVDTPNAAASVSPASDWWRSLRYFHALSTSNDSVPIPLLTGPGRPETQDLDEQRACYEEQKKLLIQMRARLTVTYLQVEEIVGLERILFQQNDDLSDDASISTTSPICFDASMKRHSLLELIRREKDAEKIAFVQQHLSRPSCLFAREMALAQACALQLL